MSEMRIHADLFNAEEAVAYLRLTSTESLRTLRENYGLQSIGTFRPPLYHREDLDRCVQKMRGIDPDAGRVVSKPLRLAGGKS